MVTESHARAHLPLLPLPLSAREVPQPTDAAMAWIIDESRELFAVQRSGEEDRHELPGSLRAQDVTYGADGTLWVLAARGSQDGSVIVRFTPSADPTTITTPIQVDKIAGGPDGTLWMISAAGEVLSFAPSGAIDRHSAAGESLAEEISAGPDGSVWVISTTARYAGRIVKRLTDTSGEWYDLPAPASATKIGVAPDGMAWTINTRGEVWRLHPTGGGSLAECQVDTACSECRFTMNRHVMAEIAVSPDGTVWAIGTTQGSDRPALMWLADPAQRRYRTVESRLRPLRVAGGVVP